MRKFLANWKAFKLFQKYSDFDKWPLSILLQIIFLNRAYLREFCCYCNKTLTFKRADKVIGDSGEICPACLLKECPELYLQLKAEGKFSAKEIEEAEKYRATQSSG